MKTNHGTMPQSVKMSTDEVHIWHAKLEVPQSGIEYYKAILSDEELDRASKYYFEKDRIQFTLSKSILRLILCKYLDVEAKDICFQFNKYGKPSLDNGQNRTNIKFNLSHAGNQALYAITTKREIGVDVEYLKRPMNDPGAIVQKFFSEHEKVLFQKVPDTMKNSVFYNFWTRKEAYIKALGKGLSEPLNTCTVITDIDLSKSIVCDNTVEKNKWVVENIKCEGDYTGAVAVAADNCELKYHHFKMTI